MKDLMKQTYIECAAGLNMGNFTNVKTGPERSALITKLADMYCDATEKNNSLLRSQTISALMLLFYGEISKMAEKCKAVKEYEYEDFAAKLYECINTACEYHAWKDGTKNAEQCIRQLIASRGAPAILYESNLDKNRANVNNYSLDVEIDDESNTTRLDMLEDDSFSRERDEANAASVIQAVLDKGDLIGGIVLDNIAFNNCHKDTKELRTGIERISDEDGNETEQEYKYYVNRSEFSERSLVKILSALPENYKDYFIDRYNVNENAISAALDRIKAVDNSKLYKIIRTTLMNQKTLVSH